MHTCRGETPSRGTELNSKLFIAQVLHARWISYTSPFILLIRISQLHQVSRMIYIQKFNLLFLAPSSLWGCFNENTAISIPIVVMQTDLVLSAQVFRYPCLWDICLHINNQYYFLPKKYCSFYEICWQRWMRTGAYTRVRTHIWYGEKYEAN